VSKLVQLFVFINMPSNPHSSFRRNCGAIEKASPRSDTIAGVGGFIFMAGGIVKLMTVAEVGGA
jgi:hypothetical protein